MKPEVKICGLTKPVDAQYVNDAGADYAGFVFFEKSRRNLSRKKAEEILKNINRNIKKVAVTVSADAAQVKELQQMGFDIIQIHGTLTKEALEAAELPVWYAVNLAEKTVFEEKTKQFLSLPEPLQKKVTAIVVDGAKYGGGKTFDWQETPDFNRACGIFKGRKFVLAGGLNAANVAEGIRLFKPDIVDVSSGVEDENGKAKALINEFIKQVSETKRGNEDE